MPATVNGVVEFKPAGCKQAINHFESLLAVETDCWDVHEALKRDDPGVVVVDVRLPDQYAQGHIPRAINLPYRRINECSLAAYAMDTLFVVYCSGPHCNGADRAALRLATLGRTVKKMIGGMRGWQEYSGFPVVKG